MVLAVDWLPMSDRGKELTLRLAWTMHYVSANGACGEWAIAQLFFVTSKHHLFFGGRQGTDITYSIKLGIGQVLR